MLWIILFVIFVISSVSGGILIFLVLLMDGFPSLILISRVFLLMSVQRAQQVQELVNCEVMSWDVHLNWCSSSVDDICYLPIEAFHLSVQSREADVRDLILFPVWVNFICTCTTTPLNIAVNPCINQTKLGSIREGKNLPYRSVRNHNFIFQSLCCRIISYNPSKPAIEWWTG